ncbi:MAG: hypothetical protein ACHRHE_17620, partial [Tepidisphaerales bacterium]
ERIPNEPMTKAWVVPILAVAVVLGCRRRSPSQPVTPVVSLPAAPQVARPGFVPVGICTTAFSKHAALAVTTQRQAEPHTAAFAVTLVNMGARDITYGYTDDEDIFGFELLDENSQPVGRTRAGLLPPGIRWSEREDTLSPGQALEVRYDLRRFFVIRRTGVYYLTVGCGVGWKDRATGQAGTDSLRVSRHPIWITAE